MLSCMRADCGLPTPKNGAVSVDSTTFGGTGNISCNTGYDLFGERNITCTANGNWSSTNYTCARKGRYLNMLVLNGTSFN